MRVQRRPILFLLLAARILGLHRQQPLPIGNGDLVVVRMDFAEGEEAVAVAAILDECRLERRLHANHLGEVDISLELPLRRSLDVEILEAATVQHHDAGFFRVGGIDQHALGHLGENSGATARRTALARSGRAWAGGRIG